jgi:hypothetical protein
VTKGPGAPRPPAGEAQPRPQGVAARLQGTAVVRRRRRRRRRPGARLLRRGPRHAARCKAMRVMSRGARVEAGSKAPWGLQAGEPPGAGAGVLCARTSAGRWRVRVIAGPGFLFGRRPPAQGLSRLEARVGAQVRGSNDGGGGCPTGRQLWGLPWHGLDRAAAPRPAGVKFTRLSGRGARGESPWCRGGGPRMGAASLRTAARRMGAGRGGICSGGVCQRPARFAGRL